MGDSDRTEAERDEVSRLSDEVEQLRTALEDSADQVTRLMEERDRLMRRVAAQSRELQAASAAYAREHEVSAEAADVQISALVEAGAEQEELRVAFEELQVLTEELEVTNNSLAETNRLLDRRVDERTQELKEKHAALAESERRFRMLVVGIPQLVWRAFDGGEWTWCSPQWTAFTGQSIDDSAGMGWLDALHPDDVASALQMWGQAESLGELRMETRLRSVEEGSYRWFHVRAAPVRDDAGTIVEWLGTCTDVHVMHELQERQTLLLAELQHRVRNILTVVRSVFGRTVDAGGDLEDVADHFKGRLDSLARTQVVVTQSAQGHVDLENLIRDELLSVGAGDGPDLTIAGPETLLPPTAAESIGLAIHELTTNALKYGALKVPGGSLSIRWTLTPESDGGMRLDLTWREQGVPAVAVTPMRRGFGTELITDALPYRLGAETSLTFRGGGVCCTISVPLAAAPARPVFGMIL